MLQKRWTLYWAQRALGRDFLVLRMTIWKLPSAQRLSLHSCRQSATDTIVCLSLVTGNLSISYINKKNYYFCCFCFRLQFLELQLELIDEWRVRLLQLTHQNYEDPLESLMPKILNTYHYVSCVLMEWGETVVSSTIFNLKLFSKLFFLFAALPSVVLFQKEVWKYKTRQRQKRWNCRRDDQQRGGLRFRRVCYIVAKTRGWTNSWNLCLCSFGCQG